jgi:uridylate kinase
MSGKAVADVGGENVIDAGKLDDFSEQIASALRQEPSLRIAIVVGAGNILPGRPSQGDRRSTVDQMGILATVINALALTNSLERAGLKYGMLTGMTIPHVTGPYTETRALEHLEENRILVLAGGAGNPVITTDAAAAIRAIELGAEVLLLAKYGTDGVYDKDPRRFGDAVKYSQIDFEAVFSANLPEMDATAVTLCRDNQIPIYVFDMAAGNAVANALLGDRDEGTLIGLYHAQPSRPTGRAGYGPSKASADLRQGAIQADDAVGRRLPLPPLGPRDHDDEYGIVPRVDESSNSWQTGLAIIEDFYGEPLTREVVSLIAQTPPEQIEELISRLIYSSPGGGWSQSTYHIPATRPDVTTVFLEASAFTNSLHEIDSLAPTLLYSEQISLVDPLMRFRSASPRHFDLAARRTEDWQKLGSELAAACFDLLPIADLVRTDRLKPVPRPTVGTREYNSAALFDDPVARLAVPLGGWKELCISEGLMNPDDGDAILAWESYMGDDDPWRQASYRILGHGNLEELAHVLATAQLTRDTGMTAIFSSEDGRRYVAWGHGRITGEGSMIPLNVPILQLDLRQALQLRDDEEVFERGDA